MLRELGKLLREQAEVLEHGEEKLDRREDESDDDFDGRVMRDIDGRYGSEQCRTVVIAANRIDVCLPGEIRVLLLIFP
jgi:hypothetical protein